MNEKNELRQSLETFRENLQKRIKDRMSRPSITESLQKQNNQQTEKKSPWIVEFREDKATYAFMAISAVFTALLGIILGLAPYTITAADGSKTIYFNTDLIHWSIAIVYAVSYVAVTEAALLVAKNKYRKREEGNMTQQNNMIIMMIVAGVSVVGTGYAGGVIGASVLGFLSDFEEIPHSAQGWAVKVIPVLIALYAFLLIGYKNSSRVEADNRLTEQMKRDQQREHQLQRDLAQLEVEEMMMLAEDRAYIEAVERGVLSAADASAAKRAGKTLRQLEAERGEDLNGDGKIESQHPAPKPEDRAGYPDNYGPLWKNSTNITPTLDAYAWACSKCEGTNAPYTRTCNWCQEPRTNGSAVTAFPNMPPAAVSSNGHKKPNPS